MDKDLKVRCNQLYFVWCPLNTETKTFADGDNDAVDYNDNGFD